MTQLLQIFFIRPARTARLALRALRRNKLRSSLTGLGIIIGVAAVVAMVAIGNGARASIESKVSSLGQNLLLVFAGSSRGGGVNGGMGSGSTLTLADAEAMGKEVPDVIAISPEVRTAGQAIANGHNWSTQISGESAQYLSIRSWSLAAGTMFTDRDVRTAAKVAVIGSKTAAQLFGAENPVGHVVRVKSIPFVIIGLLMSKGAGMGGNNQDDILIVPYTTAMKRLTGDKSLKSVNLQISSSERMATAQAQITNLLRQRHSLSADKANDFSILNQKEIADTVGTISTVITLLLGSVAGISLLVGGIGIMNIMLVSVTERTREIGIRIAVGAQPQDILLQFLIEAVTLSLFGGTVGVLIGFGASRLASLLVGFDAVVSPGSVLLAFSVSAAIGIFFGFYPARRAAAMDPIEALRYE
jgi:putative ABC transport system permease protein